MSDLPIEDVNPETEIVDKKETTLPSAPQGLKLTHGNADVITIKLLESIQNIGIRQIKLLEAIASKQGVNLNSIK